jgi:hypothetical protein
MQNKHPLPITPKEMLAITMFAPKTRVMTLEIQRLVVPEISSSSMPLMTASVRRTRWVATPNKAIGIPNNEEYALAVIVSQLK